jgi:hypothetical protein
MYASQDTDHFSFCKTGKIARAAQEIAFKQHTEKGYVFCHVIIPMDTQDCGLTRWDNAQAIIRKRGSAGYEGLPVKLRSQRGRTDANPKI